MAEITVSVQAYCKMLLHAAKYPHCAVNGVMLAEDNKNKEKKSLKCVDSIPLFHLSLSLAPMLEVALLQIDCYCKSKGLIIGGYYQANENLNDHSLSNVARHIGRKLHDFLPEACIFMIDNHRIDVDSVSEVYRVYTMKDSQWKEIDKRQTVEEETLSTASSLLLQGDYKQLMDFDNHLDDVKNDWRNLAVNDLISLCT